MCVSNHSPPSTTTSKLSTMTHWLSPDLGQCSLLVESIPDLDHFNVTAGLLHTLLLSFTQSRLLLICELIDSSFAHCHNTSSRRVVHEGAVKTQPSSLFQGSFFNLQRTRRMWWR